MRANYVANADDKKILDPYAALWNSAQAETIAMEGTPAAMQPTAAIRASWSDKPIGAVNKVSVKAIHNGKSMAFRLEWDAPRQNDSHGDNTVFPDGAAISFPLKPGASAMGMGTPDLPIGVWKWQADAAEEGKQIYAEGMGTSEVVDRGALKVKSEWKDGRWTVVILRDLQVIQDNAAVQFLTDQDAQFALAVWDGGSNERGGIKAFSGQQWLNLTLAARA